MFSSMDLCVVMYIINSIKNTRLVACDTYRTSWNDILDGLKQLGHDISFSYSHCVIQGIRKSCDLCERSCDPCRGSCNNCITAACNGRKDGVPDGY